MFSILFKTFLLNLLINIFSSNLRVSGDFLKQNDDGTSGTIQFGGPQDMNDEMMNSPFVPAELHCDACVAVSYKLWKGLSDYNSKHPSLNFNLPESTLIDVMDDVCADFEGWKEYGQKKLQKVTRLSGPGLDEVVDAPGVTASGGKWPARLQDECESMVGDHGEVTIYNVFKLKPSSQHLVKNFLCFGELKRDKCSKLEERKMKQSGGGGSVNGGKKKVKDEF